ncbi:MAG TPA: 4Fe-4S dicluster domain-containing protein [Syntrophaceae bacterium]|nr:4Fe-4S dicluster domain-containing protein [Syntrophaceae bacterium]
MPAIIDKEKCTTCGACVEACPVEAISLNDVAHINGDKCIECGTCISVCPNRAITLEGRFVFPAPRSGYSASRYLFLCGPKGHEGFMSKEEIAFLKERLSFLRQRMKVIDWRLNELEKGRR